MFHAVIEDAFGVVKRRQNEVSQVEGAGAGQFVREVAVLVGREFSSNWAVPSRWIIRGRLAVRLRRAGWYRARWGGVRRRENFLGAVGGLGESRASVFGVVGKLGAGLWQVVAAVCLFEVPHRCGEKPRKGLDLRGLAGGLVGMGPSL